jgi:hypothetical protein
MQRKLSLQPFLLRTCSYTGIRLVSFVSNVFLTRLESIQSANGPTLSTFLSQTASHLPRVVSRLPDDNTAARLPDAADRLTPSLSAFLPHGPTRPCSSLAAAPACLPTLPPCAAKWI